MERSVVINFFDGCSRHKSDDVEHDSADDFTFRWQTGQSYVEGNMARITDEQQVKVTVVAKTGRGRPAKIDGAVVYSSSDESVATVSADGMVTGVADTSGSTEPFRSVDIKAEFDADMDAGEERKIVAMGTLEVVGTEAEIGEITFGTPEAQPDAVPPVEPPVEPPVPPVEPPVEPTLR